MIADGWADYQTEEGEENREMVVGHAIVKRGEIREIIDEWAGVVYDYFRFKMLGNPYGRGWWYWPRRTVVMMDELAQAEAEWQEMKRGAKNG